MMAVLMAVSRPRIDENMMFLWIFGMTRTQARNTGMAWK